MKRISISLAALVASCAFLDSLPATCVDVDVGSNYADAFVLGGTESTANFGEEDELFVGMDADPVDLNEAHKIYIRFDLALVTPTGSPTLNLTLESSPGTTAHEFNLWGLRNHATSEAWDETTITWDNAPANTTDSYSDMETSGNPRVHGGAVLGTFTIPGTAMAGDTISIPVPLAFLTADTNNLVTFMITPNTNTTLPFEPHGFWAGEVNDPPGGIISPFLNVEGGTPAPEPSSLVLCGLAALCLGGYSAARRRFARPRASR